MDALTRFREEGWSARPKFNDPTFPFRLNWDGSLTKDEWNVTAIKLLAHRLHKALVANSNQFASENIDIESCRKQITRRLSPVMAAVRKSTEQREHDKELAMARMRRAGRRRNVRILPSNYDVSLITTDDDLSAEKRNTRHSD